MTLLRDKCPKLTIIQEGNSYRIELKQQTELEDLEKEIIAFLKKNGGKVDNLSLVLEQLKKKHPQFNLNDYGYSRVSSFLRSFNPVSYTPLDVYKRQSLRRAMAPPRTR